MTKTAFANSSPRQASFIVYINGVEVPAKSVNLRYGVWQIPEMQIDMVADPTITRLGAEDRVQVAVFYLDDTDVVPEVKPEFRLFGEGEITGWGYRNTSKGRMISFTVVNQIAVFTQLFTQFMLSVDSSLGPLTGPPGASLQPSSDLIYPLSLFTEGLIPSTGEKGAFISRPFDFLYNTVRGMMSSKIPADRRSIPAANFFTRWARLNNFHNRFAATPFFDEITDNANVFPVLRALQNTSAIDVLVKNLLPNIQNAGSFWDMLQVVYASMFMEIAMIPSMPLVTVDLASNLVQQTDFSEHKLIRSVLVDGVVRRYGNPVDELSAPPDAWVSALRSDGRKAKPKRIQTYFAKPQMLFSVPPACNAIFPSQIITLAYEENYATQPTRLYFNDETLTKLMRSPQNGVTDTINNALSAGYPFEADLGAKLQNKYGVFNGKNFLLYPEEYFKGPVMDRRDVPPWLNWLGQSQFANGNATGKSADGDVTQPAAPARTQAGAASVPPAPTGNAMVTEGRVGVVGPNGQRVFGARVETLRSAADRAQAQTGIPAEFLLAWISHESDGKLETTTSLNERGYFQIMGPHVEDGVAKTLKDVEAGSVLGLTVADTGTGPTDTTARLSRDSDYAFAQGVRLAQEYRKRANKIAVQKGVNWAEGDMWRLTKLYHNAPGLIRPFIDRATASLGYPPSTWEEMYKTIAAGLSSFESNMLQNATAVGGVVAGASGQMVTASDPKPVRAPLPAGAPAPGEGASTRLVGPTDPVAPSVPAADYADIQRNNLTVHQLYAKYEYFRERYAKRSGSAQLTWNPYVVPGFPTVLFDQRASRVDVVAYVTTVQQTMSHEGQRSTTLSFLYGRQLQEMFTEMAHEFDAFGETAAGAAPAEPVRDVRKIVQSFEQAETFYQRLFYGGQRLYNKDAAFDFRKVVGYAPTSDSDAPEQIFIEGPDEATQDALVAATQKAETLVKSREAAQALIAQLQSQVSTITQRIADALEVSYGDVPNVIYEYADADAQALNAERVTLVTQLTTAKTQLANVDAQLTSAIATIQDSQNTSGVAAVRHNLDGARELVPLSSSRALFESRDAAMRFNWRPICTLDEYVIFYEGAGEGAVPAFGHPQSVGARYFDRIRRLRPPAADFVPPPSIAEATSSLSTSQPVVEGLTSDNFPQTREAWDDALLAYKQNALGVKAPRT
jgi:hypothetical protein